MSAQNENFSESIEQLIFQTGGIPATDYLSLSKTESGNDTSNLNELQNIDLINSFIEKSEKRESSGYRHRCHNKTGKYKKYPRNTTNRIYR